MRVAKDGKLIGTHNDGTVKKAGVGDEPQRLAGGQDRLVV